MSAPLDAREWHSLTAKAAPGLKPPDAIHQPPTASQALCAFSNLLRGTAQPASWVLSALYPL